MLKLVIHTQYRENYSFDQDGNPVEGPEAHWKSKGGDTYVVPNFRLNDGTGAMFPFAKARLAVDALRPLIEYSNSASEEYILSWDLMDRHEKVCEDWESPYILTDMGDKWISIQVKDNRPDEDGYMGYMRSEILEKTTTYDLLPEGNRANYKASYLMNDGDIVDNDVGLKEWFNAQAA